MLDILFQSPISFAFLALGLVMAITIHEFAHAWVADYLGDPTPRSQDRVSLNPARHLDPLGSLALLLTGFGWGRPVIFDPYNLQNYRRDAALIALAGPASNLILAFALLLIEPFLGSFALLIDIFVHLNLGLAMFNLIPIHPLDGGKILTALIPESWAEEFDQTLENYGFMVLLLLVFPWAGGQSAVSLITSPLIGISYSLLKRVSTLITGLIL